MADYRGILQDIKRVLEYICNGITDLVADSISASLNANMFYSGFSTTLANRQELDSRWLDMGTADKYQISLLADTQGLTLVIEASTGSNGTSKRFSGKLLPTN